MRLFTLVGAIVVSFLPLAAHAQGFIAINWLRVYPVSASGTFEVVPRPGSGPMHIWCAAGDYARSVLRVSPAQRIYVVSDGMQPSRAQGGSRAVTFSVAPPKALIDGPRPGDGGNYSLSIKNPGFNISAGHAKAQCLDDLLPLDWN